MGEKFKQIQGQILVLRLKIEIGMCVWGVWASWVRIKVAKSAIVFGTLFAAGN